jgi:sulfite exporter TauE/SafE
MGFASSAHCILMCGPLMLGMAGAGGKKGAILQPILHHSGRLMAYVIIGLIFGLIGQVISLIPYQQAISIITGVLLILGVVISFLPSGRKGLMRTWRNLTTNAFQKIKILPRHTASFLRGVLNGFLPCGMVYLAATASLHAGQIEYSVYYMLLFGAGTLPALMAISFLGKLISLRMRFAKAVPYMTLIMAALFILRGLDINIPYVSPHIDIKNGSIHGCCAKK